ncbi:MAG TPA: hypothetical protein VMJ65_00685 [Solirubrobacteraceae bacterium]|nr:hypothetical protein [Solirubrobacteraceae bacterium]
MPEDEPGGESFEEQLRAIARELGRSVERAVDNIDVDDFARMFGLDAGAAREWMESAGTWLRSNAERFDEDFPVRMPDAWRPSAGDKPARADSPLRSDDPLRSAAPHPLDMPTDEQGIALAALESGRWMVEPGTDALAARGEGPGPSDALGIVRELRVRDWLGADGEITLVGRRALSRWLGASIPGKGPKGGGSTS